MRFEFAYVSITTNGATVRFADPEVDSVWSHHSEKLLYELGLEGWEIVGVNYIPADSVARRTVQIWMQRKLVNEITNGQVALRDKNEGL